MHVEEFKKELTREVMLMTQEVTRLQRERQGLEAQIADLFAFYAKQKQAAVRVSSTREGKSTTHSPQATSRGYHRPHEGHHNMCKLVALPSNARFPSCLDHFPGPFRQHSPCIVALCLLVLVQIRVYSELYAIFLFVFARFWGETERSVKNPFSCRS